MQIMDDVGEAIECETTIPNNGSPEIVKPPKVLENDEKENTDPLESNHASESIVSSEESKEIVENESKSCDDEEEESISKNDDSIQMIDSDDESGVETTESEPISAKKEQESVEDEKQEKITATEPEPKENDAELKKVLLEDLGSDEAADAKRSPEINEQNLYDDIENQLQPHVVDFTAASVNHKARQKEIGPMKVNAEPEQIKVTNATEEPAIRIEIKEANKEPTSKRRRTPSPIPSPNIRSHTAIQPSKKLRLELESSYGRHDKLLREYIEATSRNKGVEDVKQSISVLENEIKTLDAMLRGKEDEWNNILHMKLVKEEIRMRLVRRKATLEMKLTDATTIDASSVTGFQSSTPLPNKSQSHQQSAAFNAPLLQESLKSGRHGTPVQNISQTVTMMPLASSINSSTNSILHQRANMKATELIKEKQAAAKIQR